MAKIAKILTSVLALAGSSVATWPPNAKDCETRAAAPVNANDGFPTPNAQQLKAISKQADGSLSNAPPPAKLADSTLQSLQAIAVNEEFEVAYFRSLLANITTGVKGYDSFKGWDKQALEKIFKVVIAVSLSCISASEYSFGSTCSNDSISKRSCTLSMRSPR